MDIEEDIKIINNFIQNIENGFTISKEISSWEPEKRIVKAIEHLLAEREEDKKKIANLKEIDEANRKVIAEQCDYLQNRSIPKQKVKDAMKQLKLSGGSDGKDNIENLARELATEALEELLEED